MNEKAQGLKHFLITGNLLLARVNNSEIVVKHRYRICVLLICLFGSIVYFSIPAAPTPERIIHPIPKLMAEAQTKFRGMVSKQSKTLNEAVAEYKRRYNRPPPKGFDDWFAFAKKRDVKIIDEYDGMMKDFEPFWAYSGAEVRRRANQIGSLPTIDLVRIEGGKALILKLEKGFVDLEGGQRAKGFIKMLQPFLSNLPDMEFPINTKAEGRVLIPWEHRNYPNTTIHDSSMGIESVLGGPFVPDWKGDSNVWEMYRRTCHPSTEARRLYQTLRVPGKLYQRPINFFGTTKPARGVDESFTFAEEVDKDFDFCEKTWAHYQHGHFFSDWRTLSALYPVFSPGKSSGYSDLLIPSHYYWTPTARYTYGWDPVSKEVHDVDDYEKPWSEKINQIFWRGSSTGGGSSPPGYVTSYQRHRLLEMTSDIGETNRTVVIANPPGTDNFVSVDVPISQLNKDATDVAFVKAVGCDNYPGGCSSMALDYRFSESVPLREHWKYKYLIDVDGMGYSGRFMALLMSDSAVIKSTVYREYFSDWIQPWLHFIPLSSSYRELYNIHAYFSGPSEAMLDLVRKMGDKLNLKRKPKPLDGDAQLERIARAGRRWKMTIGRAEDMETYVYRLALEWARLWSDDRDKMSFK